MDTKSTVRNNYLDWLRVVAILSIFVYHTALIFAPDPFSVKNAVTYQFIDDLAEFAGLWGLPLVFLISGASVFYALGKITARKYVKGLVVRLLVPLAVGIFTHIAFQVYLENLHKGTFRGSFLDFYPHYFEGLYGFGGNFAWMGLHLWYLELLFIISLLCLPLFVWLRNRSHGRQVLQWLGAWLAKPGAIYLFALPPFILINVLDPDTWGAAVLGDWSIFIYLCYFISGFVIVSHKALQANIERWRWFSLAAGVILQPAVIFLWEEVLGEPAFGTWGAVIGTAPYCLDAWCWLLAILGFGMRHLNLRTPFLTYANEAVLPFYILHQTVVVAVGFIVVQWAIPDLLKFVLILIPSFLVIIGLYEFTVRRNNLLRFLFGMKPLAKAPTVQAQLESAHP